MSRWGLVRLRWVLAVGVLLAGHEAARAQFGVVLSGAGPENRSMGGASTAAPIDPSGALYWNPAAITGLDELQSALSGRTLVVAAGAAGVVLLPKSARAACPGLKVAIDLNAVPPLGIEGIDVTDKGKERDGVVCYGAIGVGDTKMKIHKAAIARLFERNDQIMDAEEVFALSQQLD